MDLSIEELIAQLEGTSISTKYLPLNVDQFINISKTLEHYSSGLAIGKKENASGVVEEKKREINKLLNLLIFEVQRISGPSIKKKYTSMLLDLLVAFQNLIKADTDINAMTGAVWISCRGFQTAPKTNCEQVAVLLSFVSEMLKDAFDEVNQLSKGINFEGDTLDLDEKSKSYFASSKSLVKFCILCVKKIQILFTNCKEDEGLVLESEKLLQIANSLSAKVDDFVSTLDIPLQTQEPFLLESLADIFSICKVILSCLETNDKDQAWTSLANGQLTKLESCLVLSIHSSISR